MLIITGSPTHSVGGPY